MFKILALLCLVSAPALSDPITNYSVEYLSGDSCPVCTISSPQYTGERLTISGDRGGSLFEYIEKYNGYRRDRIYIRVSDICLSACTLITGLIPDSRVCVTGFAKFGFHSAFDEDPFGGETFSKVGTALEWNIFPKKVQDLIRLGGWDGSSEHPDPVYIKGTDLYPLCPKDQNGN